MPLTESKLVSCVVPIYNVEPYLRRCLDSILRQTYSTLEIILVDDGATDQSGAICDEYAQMDTRVSVIHKENGGLSDARNVGMQQATGEYITFVDSDDYIADNYVEVLLAQLEENQADIAICGYQEFSEELAEVSRNLDKIWLFDREEALQNLLYQKYYTTAAWGRLFKRELWNGITFPVGKLYEDLAVIYRLFARSKRIVYTECQLYYYFQRTGSIMKTFKRENALDRIEHAEEIAIFMKEHFPALIRASQSRLIASAVLVLEGVPIQRENADILKKIRQVLRENRMAVLCDKQARTANRIAALLSFFGLACVKTAGKIYEQLVHVKTKNERKAK